MLGHVVIARVVFEVELQTEEVKHQAGQGEVLHMAQQVVEDLALLREEEILERLAFLFLEQRSHDLVEVAAEDGLEARFVIEAFLRHLQELHEFVHESVVVLRLEVISRLLFLRIFLSHGIFDNSGLRHNNTHFNGASTFRLFRLDVLTCALGFFFLDFFFLLVLGFILLGLLCLFL